jgi:hypothetical protein
MSERTGTRINGHRTATADRPADGEERAAVAAMGDGRHLVDAAAGRAARAAGAVRGAVRGRQPLAAAAAALLVGAAAFAAGRATALRAAGPLTRATRGRL